MFCISTRCVRRSTHPLPTNLGAQLTQTPPSQPAGTGFSYGDESGYDHNEKQVAEDMYTFLQGFYKAHPEYQSNDFYATGESYGGKFSRCLMTWRCTHTTERALLVLL